MATLFARARGGALFVAVGISALLAMFITVMFQTVMTENTGTDSLVLDAQARYLAESGAEFAITRLKTSIANSIPFAPGANIEIFNDYIPGYEPAASADERKPIIEYKAIRIEEDSTRTFSEGGITGRLQLYAVSGRGWVPDPHNAGRFAEVYINKMVDISLVPLFQYLAFYNRFSLEILPGNNTRLKGRIHSNENIFIGAESGRSMVVTTEAMTATGTMQRHRKNVDATASNYLMPGIVQIKKAGAPEDTNPSNYSPNQNNYPVMESGGMLKTPNNKTVPTSLAPTGYDSNFNGYDGNGDGTVDHPSQDLKGFTEGSQDRWKGSVQTGASGVTPLEAPTDIAAFRAPEKTEKATHKFNPATKTWEETSTGATHVPGHFLKNADLVIFGNGNVTQLQDKTGAILFESDASGAVTTNLLKDKDGNPVVPLVEKQMFDAREYDSKTDGDTAGKIKLSELDMGKLNSAYRSDTNQQVFPSATYNNIGSIVYGYRTDSTAEDPNGIRITNGSVLNNKMTFVSETPVYIKGDFNKVSGGDKGAIIMADAVNLLSNEWDDCKAVGTGVPKPGSNMEFNAAIMAGSKDTISPGSGTAAVYSGGFENFPRFHENWGGKTVSILGSFVSLFESRYAASNWGKGNVYSPPQRNWSFNEKFLNPSYSPPGFPVSVGHARVVWWKGRNLAWWPVP